MIKKFKESTNAQDLIEDVSLKESFGISFLGFSIHISSFLPVSREVLMLSASNAREL